MKIILHTILTAGVLLSNAQTQTSEFLNKHAETIATIVGAVSPILAGLYIQKKLSNSNDKTEEGEMKKQFIKAVYWTALLGALRETGNYFIACPKSFFGNSYENRALMKNALTGIMVFCRNIPVIYEIYKKNSTHKTASVSGMFGGLAFASSLQYAMQYSLELILSCF